MNMYRATIRIDGLQGGDPSEVRRILEAKLAKAEVEACRVLSIEPIHRGRGPQPQPQPRRMAPAEGTWRKQSNAGGVILLFAMGWALWVVWSYLTAYLSLD